MITTIRGTRTRGRRNRDVAKYISYVDARKIMRDWVQWSHFVSRGWRFEWTL